VRDESHSLAAELFRSDRPTLLVTDRHVAALFKDAVCDARPKGWSDPAWFVVEPGEGSKSLVTVEQLYRFLAEQKFPRDGMIVALGGGVVSDLAGFVAATWMRGVRWTICPTTLEAMIDASIGGKTAINIPGGKNLVGAFHPPELVLIDPSFLRTLPEREFRAGLAESVKHALLAGEEFLAWHETNADAILTRTPAVVNELIERNVAFKVSIVEKDPFERNGMRALLNLGHTLGHAIEETSAYALRHGECVGLGLIAACELSVQLCGLDRAAVGRVRSLLHRFGLPTQLETAFDANAILETIGRDKKVCGGAVRWILLSAIASPVTHEAADQALLRKVIDDLRR
jgi:3-dehydroquinate synthase